MDRPFEDDYFKNEEDVLAVYDFDYGASTDFNYKLQVRQSVCTVCVIPYCWPCLPCSLAFIYAPIFKENVIDAVEAQHLAITRDGIKYIVDKHKSGCRLDCQDVGKVSKTVPFDKITDCDVEEPAGASGPFCCLVQNVLYRVNVDTASGSRGEGNTHELSLAGLKDPHQFKKDVWSMKRGEGIAGSPNSTGIIVAPSAVIMDDRGGGESGKAVPVVTSGTGMSAEGEAKLLALMEEQNKLIKSQNKILKNILEK